jgi:putative thioredoxin
MGLSAWLGLLTVADVTDATFQTQVVERSRTVPVVVDLWAEWCGPCRTLGPIIEKAIAETNGGVELAKVDVDANPQVSQAFKVQSIPAVYAMVDGKVVDGFMGAQPEPQVREFVQRLMNGAGGGTSHVADLIEAGDETALRQALEIEPDNAEATTALAALLIEAGSHDEALELLARIPETSEVRHLAALARAGGEAGSDDEITTQLAELLVTVKSDDDARAKYVDLLELVDDETVRGDWRRKLSSALF